MHNGHTSSMNVRGSSNSVRLWIEMHVSQKECLHVNTIHGRLARHPRHVALLNVFFHDVEKDESSVL